VAGEIVPRIEAPVEHVEQAQAPLIERRFRVPNLHPHSETCLPAPQQQRAKLEALRWRYDYRRGARFMQRLGDIGRTLFGKRWLSRR
jgi:hypothetical protein